MPDDIAYGVSISMRYQLLPVAMESATGRMAIQMIIVVTINSQSQPTSLLGAAKMESIVFSITVYLSVMLRGTQKAPLKV